jgi:hypothetical protein
MTDIRVFLADEGMIRESLVERLADDLLSGKVSLGHQVAGPFVARRHPAEPIQQESPGATYRRFAQFKVFWHGLIIAFNGARHNQHADPYKEGPSSNSMCLILQKSRICGRKTIDKRADTDIMGR